MENINVSDDFILLGKIVDDYRLPPKQLAALSGYALATIYKYLSGECTIPSVVWRHIYRLTGDIRVIGLMTGIEDGFLVPLKPLSCEADLPTLKHLLEMRQKQLACEKYILDIIADGKIDQSDNKAIEDYKKNFPTMLTLVSQIYLAITKLYDAKGGATSGSSG